MDPFKTIRNNTIALYCNILKLNFDFSSRKNFRLRMYALSRPGITEDEKLPGERTLTKLFF